MAREHYFICPHCGNRSMGTDRNAGFRREARGCEKCGFAYLFELLDDYYPAPNAAFFACDSDGRIVDCGRGSFELTGLKTEQAIGRPVREVLRMVETVGGKALVIREEPRRAGDPAYLVARADRIREELGWRPRYDDLTAIVSHSLAWEKKLQSEPWT